MFDPTAQERARLHAGLGTQVIHGRSLDDVIATADRLSTAAGFTLQPWQCDMVTSVLAAQVDRNGPHARDIPNQPHPIPVHVHIVLEHDGETWLPGTAARWTHTHVYVHGMGDNRILTSGVWVLATDVRRRNDT